MIKAKRTGKRAARRFSEDIVAAIDAGRYLWIRAGSTHRFIGVWAVVVERRVFVRSWYMKPTGWFHTFLEEPCGAILIGKREVPVSATRVRSGRVKDAVDRAYATKYTTPASIKYVTGFARGKRKDTTMELKLAP